MHARLAHVIVAVGLTTAAVAIVFHALAPGIPWAAAVALGAIVAPPDAAAATAVLRQMKLPGRVLTILEGESLFNDASALLIFAVALLMVEDGGATFASLIPGYAASVIGSIGLGVALAELIPYILELAEDIPTSIILQFCSTFAIWILADALSLSAVLTIVSYGIGLARFAHRRSGPIVRAKSLAVWETAVFLANVLAFMLIGMQLKPLIEGLEPDQRTSYFVTGAAILVTVIIVRIIWVMGYNSAARLRNFWFGTSLPQRALAPTLESGVIISWCGIRGLVTLAAALSLPAAFPEHNLVQFVAFVVVLGTLVLQGFTLGPLMRWIQLPRDRQLDREIALARRSALEASLGALEDDASPYADALRLEYRALLEQSNTRQTSSLIDLTDQDRLRIKATRAAHEALQKLHASGENDRRLQRLLAARQVTRGPAKAARLLRWRSKNCSRAIASARRRRKAEQPRAFSRTPS